MPSTVISHEKFSAGLSAEQIEQNMRVIIRRFVKIGFDMDDTKVEELTGVVYRPVARARAAAPGNTLAGQSFLLDSEPVPGSDSLERVRRHLVFTDDITAGRLEVLEHPQQPLDLATPIIVADPAHASKETAAAPPVVTIPSISPNQTTIF